MSFANGKDAIIIYKDRISSAMITELAEIGIKLILMPAAALNDDLKKTATLLGIKLACALSGSLEAAAYVI